VSQQSETFPKHLVPLPDPEWAAWKWFVLRGAGFPVHLVSALSDKSCSDLADQLVAAEAELETAYKTAVAFVSQMLENMKQSGENSNSRRYKDLVKVIRTLRSRTLPHTNGLPPELQRELTVVGVQESKQAQMQKEYATLFMQTLNNQYETLQSVARSSKFQEAVLWQNRQAFETGVQPVLHQSGTTQPSKDRQHLELIANYLQRYCTKNDTIGFFGPVAWGTIESGKMLLETVPGRSLVKQRRSYFESWAVNAIAESISSIPGMKWWIAPRLAPYCRLTDQAVHLADGKTTQLSPTAAEILSMCNGENLPADMFSELKRKPAFHSISKEEFHHLLDDMAHAGILIWRFCVPIEVDSDVALRNRLLQIQNPVLRQSGLEILDRLQSARGQVDLSRDDPARLHSALHNLDLTFEEITQTHANRKPGETYVGRTLIYEDCQRDLTVTVTPEFLSPIFPALLLLLRSLRWMAQSASTMFLKVFEGIYSEIAAKLNTPDVPAAQLQSHGFGAIKAGMRDIQLMFEEKWARLLPFTLGARVVRFESCALKDAVEDAFPSILGAYHPAQYYSPDLMVAALDTAAIQRGDALYVLGEFHVDANTLASGLFVAQHPDVRQLLDGTHWDFSEQQRFRLIPAQGWKRLTTRTVEGLFHPEDFFLATTQDTVPPTGCSAHPVSELLVRKHDGRLVVVTRDQNHCFEVLEAFADGLRGLLMDNGVWFRTAAYTPRVQIDNLVIQRETWRIPAAQLTFATEKDMSRRFLSARKWRRAQRMPNLLFVKTPTETKPFYLDMDSPVFVDILCKMIRRVTASANPAGELTFAEMLPDPGGTWLTDGDGQRYTSEFRFAIVDLNTRSCSKSRTPLEFKSDPPRSCETEAAADEFQLRSDFPCTLLP